MILHEHTFKPDPRDDKAADNLKIQAQARHTNNLKNLTAEQAHKYRGLLRIHPSGKMDYIKMCEK